MIEYRVASDVDRDQLYVELLWNGTMFAEVWYEPRREAYVARFYGEGDLASAADLKAARDALLEARRILVERGQPALPE